MSTIPASSLGVRRVLMAGSGPLSGAEQSWLNEWIRQGYQCIRLDIDPRNKPDICASMTEIGDVGEFEVVYCCHALEHLYPHEVGRALREFHRVLAPEGKVIIMVPDLEGVEPTDEPLEMTDVAPDGTVRKALNGAGGRITGLHLFYGDASQIEQFPFMAHHSGFVQQTLGKALRDAGFRNVVTRRAATYNLIGTGEK